MNVTIQQLQLGISRFVENEIAKKATGFKKFAIYFIIPQIANKVSELVKSDNIMIKSFLDESGNIKLDSLYNMAKEAIHKSGQFELYGIIFNETDIDSLYSYIKNTIV